MTTIANDLVFPETLPRTQNEDNHSPLLHLDELIPTSTGGTGGPGGRRIAMRLLKLAVVATTLGVAAWAVAGGVGRVPSLDAVVTAPAVSLSSPIQGDISSALPRIGSRVKAGGVLAEIHDTRVEDSQLTSALSEQRALIGETSADQAQVKAVRAMIAELETRREQLRKLEAERLKSRLIEADGARIAAESTLKQRIDQNDRLKKLGENAVTPREVSDADTAEAVARAEAGSAVAQCTRLKAELAAVQDGLFSGDGSREAADARARIDELKIRLFELEAQNTRHVARLEGVRSAIASQNAKLAERSHAKIAAPVDSVVWAVPASTGTHANTSEPLVTLYDPATRFVLATVRESSAYRIQPGDHAVITFLGTGKQVNGRVQSSSGSGSRVDDSQLLARLPDNRDARAHVRIAVDEWPAEVAGASPFDQIGLEVTVSIDGSSWFKRWFRG